MGMPMRFDFPTQFGSQISVGRDSTDHRSLISLDIPSTGPVVSAIVLTRHDAIGLARALQHLCLPGYWLPADLRDPPTTSPATPDYESARLVSAEYMALSDGSEKIIAKVAARFPDGTVLHKHLEWSRDVAGRSIVATPTPPEGP